MASEQQENSVVDIEQLLGVLSKGGQITIVDKKGNRSTSHVFMEGQKPVLYKIGRFLFFFNRNVRLISLHEVEHIVDGAHTEAFKRSGLKDARDRCFSLIYGENGRNTLDLEFSDRELKKTWYDSVTVVLSRLLPQVQTAEDVAACYFRLADLNGDGRLSVDEVCTLAKRLHLQLDRQYIGALFKLAEMQGDNQDDKLDREEFVRFVKILYHCQEVKRIFDNARETEENMTKPRFGAFLAEKQKQALEQPEMAKLMQRYELSVSLRGSELLSYEGFRSFLMSDDNLLIKPESKTVYHDMTQPMTSYWIYSSHNTYLMGNQLRGDSSTNGYSMAMARGSRCVEIDCWDGSDGEPIVYHGHTLTSKIPFRDVVEAIQGSAFETSPYPVVLSLEIHCCIAQQQRMVDIMKSVFGDSLCSSLADPSNQRKMLSPEALKGKILIKAKTLQKNSTPEEHKQIAKELSDITAIPIVPMPSFRDSDGADETYCPIVPLGAVFNVAESALLELAKDRLPQLLQLTSQNFIRVYPSGLRVHSSNYNAVPALVAGCQLVSLNLQTSDKFYHINEGYFLDNGLCGYVLKQFAPPLTQPMTVHIQVIGGYQLGKITDEATVRDTLDPYVILRIYGAKEDHARFRTSTVQNNGFNPVWNEHFTFRVTRPDVALLRFIVMDDNFGRNSFRSHYTVPVKLMRSGYRCVRLDCETASSSALLVNVSFE